MCDIPLTTTRATSTVLGVVDKKCSRVCAPRIPAALALTRHGCSQRKSDTDKGYNKHAEEMRNQGSSRDGQTDGHENEARFTEDKHAVGNES